jgi:hypothetical protein
MGDEDEDEDEDEDGIDEVHPRETNRVRPGMG